MDAKQYINLTLLHVCIGSLIAFYEPLSKIYTVLIILAGIYFVVKSQNKNNEILYVIAYIAGSEVFLRTTHGHSFYEFGKYAMLLFTGLGFFYSGFPKLKSPFWIYLLLLLPSIYLSFLYIDEDLRKKVSFEILGPICLGLLALYSHKRTVTIAEINKILSLVAFPILACCTFLIINYSHNTDYVAPNTSNYYYSGIYAPNQMGTMLGLGIIIYLFKIIIDSDNRKVLHTNIIIFCLMSYRGLLTFSRGGILTAIAVIVIFVVALYISRGGYFQLKRKLSLLVFTLAAIFLLTAYQTGNSLLQRYTHVEILNHDKKLVKRGRYIQITADLKNFDESPIMGIGVGNSKEKRIRMGQKDVSTHSEITRLLSEHGILGLSALLILVFYPLQLYRKDFRNFYLLPFFVFWLFTINHAATRIIAPLFFYALALLHVKMEKDERVEIEQQ